MGGFGGHCPCVEGVWVTMVQADSGWGLLEGSCHVGGLAIRGR